MAVVGGWDTEAPQRVLNGLLNFFLEFRSLIHEGELEPWLDLVCEVFADLNIPRAYFKRHWTSDPPALRRLSGVLVAVQRSTGRMVATVRIFRRVIRVRGKPVTVGGLFATHHPVLPL